MKTTAAVPKPFLDLLPHRATSDLVREVERNAQWLHDTKARGKTVGRKYRDKLLVLVPELKRRLEKSTDESEKHDIRTVLGKAESVLRFGDVRASSSHMTLEQVVNDVVTRHGPYGFDGCFEAALQVRASLKASGYDAKVIQLAGLGAVPGDADQRWARFFKHPDVVKHYVVKSGNRVIDLTGAQFGRGFAPVMKDWRDVTRLWKKAFTVPDEAVDRETKARGIAAAAMAVLLGGDIRASVVRVPEMPRWSGIRYDHIGSLVDTGVEGEVENSELELIGYDYRALAGEEGDSLLSKGLLDVAEKYDKIVWEELTSAARELVGTDDDERLMRAYDDCTHMFSDLTAALYQAGTGSGVSFSDYFRDLKELDVDELEEKFWGREPSARLRDRKISDAVHDLDNAIHAEAVKIADYFSKAEHTPRGPDHDEVVYRFDGTNNSIAGASGRGMYVAKLGLSHLRDESRELIHCIGNFKHGHPQLLQEGITEVYSIRTSAGKTKFTIEYFIKDGVHPQRGRIRAGTVSEVKGMHNRLPGYAAGSGEMNKPDEVRLVVDFLVNYLKMPPEKVEGTPDIRAGVLAMKAAGVNPFQPPTVRKRPPPSAEVSSRLLSASMRYAKMDHELAASLVEAAPYDGWKNLKTGKLAAPIELEDAEGLWKAIAARIGHDPEKGVEMRAPIIGGRRRYHHRPLRSYHLSNDRTLTLTTDGLEAKTWNNLKNKRHPAMPRIYDVFSVKKKGEKEAKLWAIAHEQLYWPIEENWNLFVDSFFKWRAMDREALSPAKSTDLEGFLRWVIDPEQADPKTTQKHRIEVVLPWKMTRQRRDDVADRRKKLFALPDLEEKIKWAKSALKYLHQNKVKFRDFDPSNLAMTKKGDRVVITNLAESRSIPTKTGRTGRVKGSAFSSRYTNKFDFQPGRVYSFDELPTEVQEDIDVQFSDQDEQDEYNYEAELLSPEDIEERTHDSSNNFMGYFSSWNGNFSGYEDISDLKDPEKLKVFVKDNPNFGSILKSISYNGVDFPPVGEEGKHRLTACYVLGIPCPYLSFVKKDRTLNGSADGTWYHTTSRKNLPSILREGLKINKPANYSQASSTYMKDVYGMVPVFLSKKSTPYDGDDDAVVLAVDVSGLSLAADIPSLADKGAYIEEDHVWFEEAPDGLDEEIPFDDLMNGPEAEAAINLTGTAVVLQDIEPSRISVLGDVSGSAPSVVEVPVAELWKDQKDRAWMRVNGVPLTLERMVSGDYPESDDPELEEHVDSFDFWRGRDIEPIYAERNNGKWFVHDGLHRLAAAKAEGLENIPVILGHFRSIALSALGNVSARKTDEQSMEKAIKFYSIIQEAMKHPDIESVVQVTPRKGIRLPMRAVTDDPELRNLTLVVHQGPDTFFRDKGLEIVLSAPTWGFSAAEPKKSFVRAVSSAMVKNPLVHELVHFVDFMRIKGWDKAISNYPAPDKDFAKYANHPVEMNAYFQQSIADFVKGYKAVIEKIEDDTGPGSEGQGVRLHRGILQPAEDALRSGLREPRGL
jgi:hypothetical protein